jgi:transposase-like protein
MGKKGNRKYTPEFRQQAAELASRVGTTRAARQLGVSVANVHTWKKKADNQMPQSAKVKLNL